MYITSQIGCSKKNNDTVDNTQHFPKKLPYLQENNLKGHIIQYSEFNFPEQDTTNTTWEIMDTYGIDSDGNLLEKKHFDQGGKRYVTLDRVTNVLPKKTNSYEKIYSSYNYRNAPIGSYRIKTTLKNSEIIEQTMDFTNDKITQTSHLKYDSKNNVVERKIFDEKNVLRYNRAYKYDKTGNKIEEAFYDTYKIENKPFLKILYQYDKWGNVISEENIPLKKEYNQNYFKATFKYKYDNAGNWTRKLAFIDDDTIAAYRDERVYLYSNRY